MNPSCGLSTLITKVIFLSALDISRAVPVVVFALDSPEREKREESTTPCGVKDVEGPGSRAQSRLTAEKTECPLQRTTTRILHLSVCCIPARLHASPQSSQSSVLARAFSRRGY